MIRLLSAAAHTAGLALIGCLLWSAVSCSSEPKPAHSADGSPYSDAGAGGAEQPVSLDTGDSVLERNNHASRDGLFLQPTLSAKAVGSFAMDADFAASFSGEVRSSPLFLADGPDGHGLFFTTTLNNDVFAFSEIDGALIWSTRIGEAAAQTGVHCGNVHPLGILSTPVIDAANRTIYVAGAIGSATSILRHEIHALSVDDGSERAGFPIDVTGMTSGEQTFVAPPENQRAALSLVGGRLYVAYGGHSGDCGPYHGWVIAVDTADPSLRGAWATLGEGEGIWAAGGLASDGKSVFAVTGNSTVGASDRAHSDSEQLLRLTGLAELDRSEKNLYFPTTWKAMDASDADFGSSNPIYLSIPGATPKSYLMALSKDGHLYLLNSTNLGGMGGEVLDLRVASGAGSVRTSPATYTTARGVHVVLSTASNPICPTDVPSGKQILSVVIKPGSPPTAAVDWCAPLDGPVTAPIATTTDGTSSAVVWYISDGKLMAVDGDTGASLFASTDACDDVQRWTSPIAVKGRIVVAGTDHLCSWSAH